MKRVRQAALLQAAFTVATLAEGHVRRMPLLVQSQVLAVVVQEGEQVQEVSIEESVMSASLLENEGLENEGVDCWQGCGQSGPCSWCGSGKCCRKGWNNGEKGCEYEQGGVNQHVCVRYTFYAEYPQNNGCYVKFPGGTCQGEAKDGWFLDVEPGDGSYDACMARAAEWEDYCGNASEMFYIGDAPKEEPNSVGCWYVNRMGDSTGFDNSWRRWSWSDEDVSEHGVAGAEADCIKLGERRHALNTKVDAVVRWIADDPNFPSFTGLDECPFRFEDLTKNECEQLANDHENAFDMGDHEEAKCSRRENTFIYRKETLQPSDKIYCKLATRTDGLHSTRTQKAGSISPCSDNDWTTKCNFNAHNRVLVLDLEEPLMLMRIMVANLRASSGLYKVSAFDGNAWNTCDGTAWMKTKSTWSDVYCHTTLYAEKIKFEKARDDGMPLAFSEVVPQGQDVAGAGVGDAYDEFDDHANCHHDAVLSIEAIEAPYSLNTAGVGVGRCEKGKEFQITSAAECECAVTELGHEVETKSSVYIWRKACGCSYNPTTQHMQWNGFRHGYFCYESTNHMGYQDRDSTNNGLIALCVGSPATACEAEAFQHGEGAAKLEDFLKGCEFASGGTTSDMCEQRCTEEYDAPVGGCICNGQWQQCPCAYCKKFCLLGAAQMPAPTPVTPADAAEICDSRDDCWGFTMQGNQVQYVRANATDPWKCDGIIGLKPQTGVKTFRKNVKQFHDVAVLEGQCFEYTLATGEMQRSGCTEDEDDIADLVKWRLDADYECAQEFGWDYIDSKECLHKKTVRRAIGPELWDFWKDKTAMSQECFKTKALEETAEFKNELEAPSPMRRKYEDRRRRFEEQRRLSEEQQEAVNACYENAQTVQSKVCNQMRESAAMDSEIDHVMDLRRQAMVGEENRSTHMGIVHDSLNILQGVLTLGGEARKKEGANKHKRTNTIEMLSRRRLDPLTGTAVATGLVMSTVDLFSNYAAGQAQSRMSELANELQKMELQQDRMFRDAEIADTCENPTTGELYCRLEQLGYEGRERSRMIHEGFAQLAGMTAVNHVETMRAFQKTMDILESHTDKLESIEAILERMNKDIEHLLSLQIYVVTLGRVQDVRFDMTRGKDDLEHRASPEFPKRWCNYIDDNLSLEHLDAILMWMASDEIFELAAPERQRVDGEENLWTECDKDEYRLKWTDTSESLQILFEHLAARRILMDGFLESSIKHFAQKRAEMATIYNEGLEKIRALNSTGVKRCNDSPSVCPPGYHPSTAAVQNVTVENFCEVNTCGCHLEPDHPGVHGQKHENCTVAGVTEGCAGPVPVGWFNETQPNGLIHYLEERPICPHGTPESDPQKRHNNHGKHLCSSCNDEVAKMNTANNQCVEYKCRCHGGEAAKGRACPFGRRISHNGISGELSPHDDDGDKDFCISCDTYVTAVTIKAQWTHRDHGNAHGGDKFRGSNTIDTRWKYTRDRMPVVVDHPEGKTYSHIYAYFTPDECNRHYKDCDSSDYMWLKVRRKMDNSTQALQEFGKYWQAGMRQNQPPNAQRVHWVYPAREVGGIDMQVFSGSSHKNQWNKASLKVEWQLPGDQYATLIADDTRESRVCMWHRDLADKIFGSGKGATVKHHGRRGDPFGCLDPHICSNVRRGSYKSEENVPSQDLQILHQEGFNPTPTPYPTYECIRNGPGPPCP